MASVQSWLYKMTEPVLGPIRRTLPPMGGLDLSPMLLLIALQILGKALA
jgi:YggT family protein